MQPGAHSNYPRPPRPPEFNWGVISEAFNLVLANWQLYVVASLLLFGVALLPTIGIFAIVIPQAIARTNEPQTLEAMLQSQLATSAMTYPLYALTGALLAPVHVGICNLTFKLLRKEPVDASDILFGFKRFGQAFIVGLLVYIGVLLGSACCYLPALVIGGFWMLAIPMLADQNIGAFEAMGASWQLMRPFWIMGAVMYLLISLLSTLGVIACGIGLFLTMPLISVIPALIYRDLGRPTWSDPFFGNSPAGTPPPPVI